MKNRSDRLNPRHIPTNIASTVKLLNEAFLNTNDSLNLKVSAKK